MILAHNFPLKLRYNFENYDAFKSLFILLMNRSYQAYSSNTLLQKISEFTNDVIVIYDVTLAKK